MMVNEKRDIFHISAQSITGVHIWLPILLKIAIKKKKKKKMNQDNG